MKKKPNKARHDEQEQESLQQTLGRPPSIQDRACGEWED
jgi:hypothetical protein